MAHKPRAEEQPAVKTTIVGGRPPGAGKAVGAVPRGIEVLTKKAAVDAGFCELLLAKRGAAADEIGLALSESERSMLAVVPESQLRGIIANTRVPGEQVPALLAKTAAVMLAALGLVQVLGCDQGVYSAGSRPETEPKQDTTQVQPATRAAPEAAGEDERPIPTVIVGVRVQLQPATKPGSGDGGLQPGIAGNRPPTTTAPAEPIEVAGARADRPAAVFGVQPGPAAEDEGPMVPVPGAVPRLPKRPATTEPSTTQAAVEDVRIILSAGELPQDTRVMRGAMADRPTTTQPATTQATEPAAPLPEVPPAPPPPQRVAGVMVDPRVMRGLQADRPASEPTTQPTSQPTSQPAPDVKGVRPDRPEIVKGLRADPPERIEPVDGIRPDRP